MTGRPVCANCGHTDHTDAINGDYCFKVTTGGLCGCEDWMPTDDEAYAEEPDAWL